jgi:hypothetical protein
MLAGNTNAADGDAGYHGNDVTRFCPLTQAGF